MYMEPGLKEAHFLFLIQHIPSDFLSLIQHMLTEYLVYSKGKAMNERKSYLYGAYILAG